MANLFDLLSKGINALNPLAWIGDAIGGVTSLITSDMANRNAQKLTSQQISAQKQMNERNVSAQLQANQQNIASQEKINQQQLDFAQGINDIMRQDSLNAVSNKKADLQRAGYSTADPSLQGFSVPSLSQPSLSAPQVNPALVESEFTSDMADSLIRSKSSSIENLSKLASTMSSIALQRAQRSNVGAGTDKIKAETEGILKSNAWIDLKESASYDLAVQAVSNALKDGKIKDYQADQIAQDLSTFETRFSILKEQLNSLNITNDELRERLHADLSETLSRVSNIRSDTSNKNKQGKLLDLDKDLKDLEYKYRKLGLSFDSSDLFSSIARIAVSGSGPEIFDSVMTNIDQMIGTLVEGLYNGAVTAGKNVVKKIFKVK